MACNKTVRAKAESLFEEGAEFHGAVADSAGVGREPPAVGGSEIGDDAGLEFSAQIQNPERHAQYTAVFSQSADGLCVFLFQKEGWDACFQPMTPLSLVFSLFLLALLLQLALWRATGRKRR